MKFRDYSGSTKRFYYGSVILNELLRLEIPSSTNLPDLYVIRSSINFPFNKVREYVCYPGKLVNIIDNELFVKFLRSFKVARYP